MREFLPSLLAVCLILAPAAASASSWDNGIIAYWDFDDGAYECTGSGIDGVVSGASAVQGVRGGALQFDGVDDCVLWPNCSALNPTDGITVSAWYRPVSFRGRGTDPILCKGYVSHSPPYYQYHLGVCGDLYTMSPAAVFDFSVSVSGQRYRVSTDEDFWTAGTWYHLAGVYDGSAVLLYVDAVLVDSIHVIGTLDAYETDLHMGKYGNLDFYLPGTIDEVAVYGRGLSADEVAALHSLSPPDYLSPDPLLEQNFPNPFNPVTSIPFALPQEATVKLSVYGADGRLVKELEKGSVGPGRHVVGWNGTDSGGNRLGSGVYFVRLEVGDDVSQRKLVLLR